MSRWIDADALKQKYTMATTRYSGGIMERPVVVLEAIDDAPSIDIVRCGECKYWKESQYYPEVMACTYVMGATFTRQHDDFCSRGEREGE